MHRSSTARIARVIVFSPWQIPACSTVVSVLRLTSMTDCSHGKRACQGEAVAYHRRSANLDDRVSRPQLGQGRSARTSRRLRWRSRLTVLR
jgi:hypothetical protein